MLSSQRLTWIAIAVVALAIIGLGYFLFIAPAGEKAGPARPASSSLPAPAAEVSAPAAPAPTTAVTPLDLDLDASDDAVRRLVLGQDPPEALRVWLKQKDLLRTAVAAVDAIARGESPAPLLPFLSPAGTFAVAERGGRVIIDPKSFLRYDPLAAAFQAVPDASWLRWYAALRPTLEKAFRELGYPEVTFAERLQQAIGHLLLAPPIAGDIVLERKMMSYAFADPELEGLSAAQKHLLRTGPANAARLQAKLRSLSRLLRTGGEK
jgi:hypothetical protein